MRRPSMPLCSRTGAASRPGQPTAASTPRAVPTASIGSFCRTTSPRSSIRPSPRSSTPSSAAAPKRAARRWTEPAPRLRRQAGFQQGLAEVSRVRLTFVVLGLQIGLDAESGLAPQRLACLLLRRFSVAQLCKAGRQKRGMRMIRRGDTLERLDRLAVAPGREIGAPQVTPEPLRVIGVESHRLPDPLDAFLRPSDPG